MNLTAFLRILFRRKALGLPFFVAVLFVAVYTAATFPLSYEAQAILNYEPDFVPDSDGKKQLDSLRAVSEPRKLLTVFESRAMLQSWHRALSEAGLTEKTLSGIAGVVRRIFPRSPVNQYESELKKLNKALTVKPVMFTGVMETRVKGQTPELAMARLTILISLYQDWVVEESRKQSEALVVVLRKRFVETIDIWKSAQTELVNAKRTESITRSANVELQAKMLGVLTLEKVYQSLAADIEKAERRLISAEKIQRMRVIEPPVVSHKPAHSRQKLILLAVLISIFLTLALIFFMEWIDPSVHRIGDIWQLAPSYPVLTIPRANGTVPSEAAQIAGIGPLLETIREIIREHRSAVVQIVSSNGNGTASNVSNLLSKIASSWGYSPNAIRVLDWDGKTNSSEKIKETPLLTFFNLDSTASAGSNLLKNAHITCVIVDAGKTRRTWIQAVGKELARRSDHSSFFVLHHHKDPLPAWFRS